MCELVCERQFRNLHLFPVEQVLKTLAFLVAHTAARAVATHARLIQHRPVVDYAIHRYPYTFGVIGAAQHERALWVQTPETGI
jgi:hypothetical protein